MNLKAGAALRLPPFFRLEGRMKVIHQPKAKTEAERRLRDEMVRRTYHRIRHANHIPPFAMTKEKTDVSDDHDSR